MKGDTPLDYAVFQLNESQSRCELWICAGEKNEKLASGSLKPFVAHLRAGKEQLAKGSNFIILQAPPFVGDGSPWFTKRTVERFVRFVSTPDILESVSVLEAELGKLDDATNILISDSSWSCNPVKSTPVTPRTGTCYPQPDTSASSEQTKTYTRRPSFDYAGVAVLDGSKRDLLKAMETRRMMLLHEQKKAFASATAAGFTVSCISDLMVFANCFGAPRLWEACLKFMTLCKKTQDSTSEKLHSEPASSDSSGIQLMCNNSSDTGESSSQSGASTSSKTKARRTWDPQVLSTLQQLYSRKVELASVLSPDSKKLMAPGDSHEKSEFRSKVDSKRISVQDAISLFESKQPKKEDAPRKKTPLRDVPAEVPPPPETPKPPASEIVIDEVVIPELKVKVHEEPAPQHSDSGVSSSKSTRPGKSTRKMAEASKSCELWKASLKKPSTPKQESSRKQSPGSQKSSSSTATTPRASSLVACSDSKIPLSSRAQRRSTESLLEHSKENVDPFYTSDVEAPQRFKYLERKSKSLILARRPENQPRKEPSNLKASSKAESTTQRRGAQVPQRRVAAAASSAVKDPNEGLKLQKSKSDVSTSSLSSDILLPMKLDNEDAESSCSCPAENEASCDAESTEILEVSVTLVEDRGHEVVEVEEKIDQEVPELKLDDKKSEEPEIEEKSSEQKEDEIQQQIDEEKNSEQKHDEMQQQPDEEKNSQQVEQADEVMKTEQKNEEAQHQDQGDEVLKIEQKEEAQQQEQVDEETSSEQKNEETQQQVDEAPEAMSNDPEQVQAPEGSETETFSFTPPEQAEINSSIDLDTLIEELAKDEAKIKPGENNSSGAEPSIVEKFVAPSSPKMAIKSTPLFELAEIDQKTHPGAFRVQPPLEEFSSTTTEPSSSSETKPESSSDAEASSLPSGACSKSSLMIVPRVVAPPLVQVKCTIFPSVLSRKSSSERASSEPNSPVNNTTINTSSRQPLFDLLVTENNTSNSIKSLKSSSHKVPQMCRLPSPDACSKVVESSSDRKLVKAGAGALNSASAPRLVTASGRSGKEPLRGLRKLLRFGRRGSSGSSERIMWQNGWFKGE